jgi:undecaprenyl-diphosphatase
LLDRARRIVAMLTLRSLIELGLAAIATLAFVGLALQVLEHHADAFDQRTAQSIRAALDSSAANLIFESVTYAGSGPFLLVVTVAGAFVTFRRGFRWGALVLVANGLLVDALQMLLKNCVARERPHLDPLIPLPASFSFPSGHAMASLAIYSTIAFAIGRTTTPRIQLTIAVLVTLLVAAIGLSRIYLGVHWPLDVLAGYLAGIPLFAVSAHVMRRLDPTARLRALDA